MTFWEYMNKVETCLRELANSSFWCTQPYEVKLLIVTAYIALQEKDVEVPQTVHSNPMFIETDVLGNPKPRKPGRPKKG